jgi:predicted metal-dependent hydrolase
VTRPPARDRDAGGRPRNARLRDGLGRPLPRSAAPADEVPRVPDELTVSPAQAADLGGRLLAEGRPFHAHEVFEAAWKSTAGPDRELWRGLAQIAVGLTHARRGNARGAVALLRRGAERIAGFPGSPAGVDPGFVAASAAEIADRIERDGLGILPAEILRLRLRRRPDG